MTKSHVCEEKDITAAKQTCVKKTNLLVYERQKGEGCRPQPKTYTPSIACPQVKRIRICTGAELKKICPPPPCPCPPKVRRLNVMQRLGRIVLFGAKSLLALGAVYATYEMGVWGDSECTAKLYKNVCAAVLPQFLEPKLKEKPLSSACKAEMELFSMFEKDPYCCDKFPIDHESGVYELQQKWNRIVTTAFSTIAGLPAHVTDWSHQVYCKMFDSESCKALKTEEEEIECCPCD